MESSIIEKLDTFFLHYPLQEFRKGDSIIQAGTEPAGIFYIQSGVIRSYWISHEGNEVTQNMYKAHAFLPMSWAIAGIKNNSFYEAMSQVVVRRAPKEAVLEFLKKEPDVLYDLLRRVYIGMEGLWIHFESITIGNSAMKLIISLVILARRFGKQDKNGITIQLTMSEQDIANYAGMSRETANRELQKLKKENLIDFKKSIVVLHNMQKLEKMLLS